MVAHPSLPPSIPDRPTAHGRQVLETTTASVVGDVLDVLALEPSERVLHLAGGTGALARAIGRRVRTGGRVSAVGAEALVRCPPRLPYPDASFDAVVSLHGIEALADRAGALAELRRLLVPSGRLAVAVWGPLEGNPAFSVLADSLRRRGGVRAEAAVHWLSSLSQQDDMRALLAEVGFDHLGATRRTVATAPSMEELFGWLLGTFPIGAAIRTLPTDRREGVVADLEHALAPLATHGIAFTTDVHAARVADREGRGSVLGTR